MAKKRNRNSSANSKKAAAERQAYLSAKRQAEKKAEETALIKKEEALKKKRVLGNKTIIAAALGIVLLAAIMVGVDKLYLNNTTEEYRTLNEMSQVSDREFRNDVMAKEIAEAVHEVGESDIQFWKGESGILIAIPAPTDSATAQLSYRRITRTIDPATGDIVSEATEETVSGKEYIRLMTSDILRKRIDTEQYAQYQVLETGDGIIAMMGSAVDGYLADLAVIREENPEATTTQQFELLKAKYSNKAT